jgi:uncharacterized protein (TIGR00369 family)
MSVFKQINNFDRTLGIELEKKGDQFITHMEVDDRHMSSPQAGHGGAIAALMDATLGATTLFTSFELGYLCSTMEFKINYIKPAIMGDHLVGTAKIDYQGKSHIVCSGEIKTADDKKTVAKAIGTFNLYPFDKKDLSAFMP